MSKPSSMDRDVKVMFTDQSTRDFIITASNIKEAEEVFDLIFNRIEQSIKIILYNIKLEKKTKVWVEYHIDKEHSEVEEDDNEV